MRALSHPLLPARVAGPTERRAALFDAAVTAFCALDRPSRGEIVQIDTLATSLLPHVPPSSRRFAAAAFSDSAYAPPNLVRRLCEDAVEVAAPLLARSPILSDIDLVGLIARGGEKHARAIARRRALHPAIADLVRTLLQTPLAPATPLASAAAKPPAEDTRGALRAIMGGQTKPARAPAPKTGVFARLRDTALDPHTPFFETALADATGVTLDAARRIAADGLHALPRALEALGLLPEQAFLIVAARHPALFASLSAVQRFVSAFAGETAPPRLKRA